MLHNLIIFALITLGSAADLKYAAFVVDDTASMANEIEGVKQWITKCMSGSDEPTKLCENTNQFILSTFNDPTTSDVIGPTTNDAILKAISMIKPHGGGDCSESLYGGIENALSAVPDVGNNTRQCTVFLFSDGEAKDLEKATEIYRQASKKGCLITIVLLGCCAEVCNGCPSTDPRYCINDVNYKFGDIEQPQYEPDNPSPEIPPTETTEIPNLSTTVSQSSPPAPLVRDPYYAVFLLDDSMGFEMEFVKLWVNDCLKGLEGEHCLNFKRFVLINFNDDKTGKVVGPTMAEPISQALGNVTTGNGKGQCLKLVNKAIIKAVSAIPLEEEEEEEEGVIKTCFVFLFTNSMAKEEKIYETTLSLQSRNCNVIPILSGCCGYCSPYCPVENYPYCVNQVFQTMNNEG